MEQRIRYGGIIWDLSLSTEEVNCAQNDYIMKPLHEHWNIDENDGSAKMRAWPWNDEKHKTGMIFEERLGQYGFETETITTVDGVEIVEESLS